MADQFNADWARGIIEDGVQKAQSIMDDPEQIDGLLEQLQAKLGDLPAAISGAFENIPLMASMVKSYITREYTEVSPKVVISLVSAFLYLVKQKDLIPDSIPIVGYADDVAVAAVAMLINEPELKAYDEWRKQAEARKAGIAADPGPIDIECVDASTDKSQPSYGTGEDLPLE